MIINLLLDSNILNINIFDNDKKDIKEITSKIENGT